MERRHLQAYALWACRQCSISYRQWSCDLVERVDGSLASVAALRGTCCGADQPVVAQLLILVLDQIVVGQLSAMMQVYEDYLF